MVRKITSLSRWWRNDCNVTFEKTTYAGLPHKFEAGTPNICGGIAFGAALDYMNSLVLIILQLMKMNF